ncbi:MAG: hypothetical protein D6731_04605 [Planctomycetota bacterium]|nr:MAG: hypothetical protein D6731_04605 [Planctomycetota bacterium]
MTPRWVKKRDGRIQPYDEARIANGVLRAGRRSGSEEEVERLAREMASAVTLYLAKQNERAPKTSAIASALEDALEGSGHQQIARMVRDWREWRQKRMAEIRVRESASSGGDDDPELEVLSLRAARPWTKRRIVKALQAEAELELDKAEDVARAVEERVFAAGLNQISSNLLRELIDAELFERGFSAQLRKLEVLGVPKPELERLAFLGQGSRDPRTLEERVSRMALERFALDEVVSGQGAVAHRRGQIHLVGLGRPFRIASGAVCARMVCEGAVSASEAIRRLLRIVRGSLARYDLMFGLVHIDEALAPFVGDPASLRESVEVLVDALYAPQPDVVPPALEVVLVVPRAGEPGTPERRALDAILAVFAERGAQASGLRVLVGLGRPRREDEALLRELVEGARAGAGFDLVVGDGPGLCSRAMIPWLGTIQIGMLNLAGIALAAGRGERERFSRGLREAVEAALEAFHKRRRKVFASMADASLPLFAGASGEPVRHGPEPDALADAMGVVGLGAAMRYLTGMDLCEHPRVAELALEVLGEVRAELDRVSVRLGLGQVVLEDTPSGDAGISLAAADLDRFADARELLGSDAGWDTGARVPCAESSEPLDDLRVRLWLARRTKACQVLSRPVLARVPDVEAFLCLLSRAGGTSRSILTRESTAS